METRRRFREMKSSSLCLRVSMAKTLSTMRTLLVTGAAGFIGSNFVRLLMSREKDLRLIAFDKLTYAGNLANLQDLLFDDRLTFVRGDICKEAEVWKAWESHQ